MKRDKIRVVKVTGSPYEMGYQHGEQYREEIRHYAKERVHLVANGTWSGKHQITEAEVIAAFAAGQQPD